MHDALSQYNKNLSHSSNFPSQKEKTKGVGVTQTDIHIWRKESQTKPVLIYFQSNIPFVKWPHAATKQQDKFHFQGK